MKKLAVFDLDGTLHHTELALAPAIARATADITGEEEPPHSLINSLYGEPLEMFCKVLAGTDEPAVCKRFVERVQFHQARTLPTSGELYPGVLPMLDNLLTMGFDLAILSNAHGDYIVLVTETLGIKDRFTSLTGRTDEPSKTARLAEMSRLRLYCDGWRQVSRHTGGSGKCPSSDCLLLWIWFSRGTSGGNLR